MGVKDNALHKMGVIKSIVSQQYPLIRNMEVNFAIDAINGTLVHVYLK